MSSKEEMELSNAKEDQGGQGYRLGAEGGEEPQGGGVQRGLPESSHGLTVVFIPCALVPIP